MTRRIARTILALSLSAAACGRVQKTAHRALPAGDAIWFPQGLGAAQAETEEILARGGFAHVFLPGLQLTREGAGWKTSDAPPPQRPVRVAPVVLVVHGDADFIDALAPGAVQAPGAALGDALKRLLARRASFGRVEGVHLDLPFSQATVEGLAALAGGLRPSIPRDLFLTCSLRFVPPEKEREDFEKKLSTVDGFVAFVFGTGEHADTVATDAIGKPWWAAYAPGAHGQWTDASGGVRGTLGEKLLGPLTDDARVTLGHDMAVREEGVSGYVFRPVEAGQIAGLTVNAGDQILFQQPLLSELIYRFGSDLSGRHLVRGRLIVLEGADDSERLFTLAALSDVILGRPLLPDVRVSVQADAAGARLRAENGSSHTSVISRTANWVEVDVPSGHIRDVQLGGFDRYEVFDADGQPVTMGRATRVRFYETLIAPHEKIEGAAILVRGRPSADCCRFRLHLLASAGTEISGDWSAPPPRPTPTPVTRRKTAARPARRR